jgi:TatD DNase family protein
MLVGVVRPELIDTHCHLYLGELAGRLAAAWERARAAGVVQAIVPAIDAESARRTLALVADEDDLFAAVGIHPNETAAAGPDDFASIEAAAREKKVVAIGETGLDLHRERAALKVQRESLLRHAELARACDLPLVLHVRKAFAPVAESLAPFARRGGRAVLHCFDGGPAELHPFVEWGFHVSFSGILTYPKREDLRAAAREVPLDRLLVETDAPFLAPAPLRGRTNEPEFLVHTARRLAEVRGIAFDELAAVTTENARRFFRLPEPGEPAGSSAA